MKSIGIITIHRIYNYGSVLQAYALQEICRRLGYEVEIIDYTFPNAYQRKHGVEAAGIHRGAKDVILKYLYGVQLFIQHKKMLDFVSGQHDLSAVRYGSPETLRDAPPEYDIYMTGSDQVWNPNYTCGDPSFFLDFAPEGRKRISYAASFGVSDIEGKYVADYRRYLGGYSHISVRELSGVDVVKSLTGRTDTEVVLDPTLLLNKEEWRRIASPGRLVKEKYILCYYLNYSFDAFPYVDLLADHVQKITGYRIVKLGRPPHRFLERRTSYMIGVGPGDFLALFRDAEFVLTTSFHGTAFAVNFGKAFYSVVADRRSDCANATDSRQTGLLRNVGLEARALPVNGDFPLPEDFPCDYGAASEKLDALRVESIEFLKKALEDGI